MIFNTIIGILAGAATTGLVTICRTLHQHDKQGKNEFANIKAGLLGILHDRIYQAAEYYAKVGWCSYGDKKNIEYLYKPYAALGGNGTGKAAYETIQALPTGPEK